MGGGTDPGPGGTDPLGPILGGLLDNTPGGRANPLMRVTLHLLSGSPARGVPGGLGVLLEQLTAGGLGRQARSWVAQGRNQPVSGKEITDALGRDEMTRLAGQAGLTREEAAAGIAMALPTLVDAVTPEGEPPDQDRLDDVVRRVLGEIPAVTGDEGTPGDRPREAGGDQDTGAPPPAPFPPDPEALTAPTGEHTREFGAGPPSGEDRDAGGGRGEGGGRRWGRRRGRGGRT
jgi:uncharacterized protein YidB (DUF937 family)